MPRAVQSVIVVADALWGEAFSLHTLHWLILAAILLYASLVDIDSRTIPDACILADSRDLRPDLYVSDIIYNPRETVLLREAARAGIPCAGGMTMLIGQAVAAEEIWLGRSLPEGLTDTLARELKLL